MRIEDFLNRLEPTRKRRDGRGNWICKCPAHDDGTESLHVQLGRNKKGQEIILAKCLAGCGLEAILAALGLRLRDLTIDDLPPWEGPERPAPRGAAKTQALAHLPPAKEDFPRVHTVPPKKEAEHGARTLEKVYDYQDEQGRTLYQAMRFRFADGKKTFRQRRPDPNRAGEWIYTMEGVRLVIYRLPEVLAAIQEKKPIFLAEGEKDADTLCAMGLQGTSAPMGAGKWKADYNQYFKGAECYILPDNDGPGWSHARDIAKGLEGVAESARILDLKRIWPDMPEKADVSDLAASRGMEATRAALLTLAKTPPTERADMPALFERIPGYRIWANRICKDGENGPRPLCNFIALPVGVVTLDDGVTQKSMLEIKGWTAEGKPLPLARVAAGSFPAMGWLAECWDVRAAILPGTQTRDQLRYAISEAGRMTAARETEYTHTGWRQIDGQWAYLHGGGAIGGEGVRTRLDGALARYGLPEDTGYSKKAGYKVGLAMLALMADTVAVPLLAAAYLAPLQEFLQRRNIPPSFALFLLGTSGTLKSTTAAMALCHFGLFNEKTPTASFKDTGNSAREKAFTLKDSMLWVDDYHPVSGQQEKRKMDTMAQDLARAFGDHAERGRLNADRTLQTARPPRCLCLMTGEDLPGIGQSGLARFFIISMARGAVPVGEALTALQGEIRAGALQSAMRGYIDMLRPQCDALGPMLESEFKRLRQEAARRAQAGGHGRSAENLAHLMLGWQMMLVYGNHIGAIAQSDIPAMMDRGWAALLTDSALQTREAQEDAPEARYLSSIAELLTSKQAFVIDISPGAEPRAYGDKPGMIGWLDEKHYLLLPDMTYQAVQTLWQRQGQTFPLSLRGIHKALKDKGLLLPEGDSPARHKWIGGRSIRLLHIPRHLIDGGDPPAEQTEFQIVDEKTPWDKEE